MHHGITVLAASALFFSLGTSVLASDMTDCTYKGKVAGKTATIVVKGGQPVSYKWGSYKAKKVYKASNIIHIDQAVIENLKVGATQSGKAAFQGDFVLNGKTTKLTMACS